MLIGQLAVMANGLIDTVMSGRLSATDLAAVGLAGSIQITVYVALNGIIMGISPIIGQHFGAKDDRAIGQTVQQGIWVATLLSLFGALLLLMNPLWLSLAQAPSSVASIAAGYLNWSALGIPAALLFRVFYAASSAISLPRVVMTIQLLMLLFKIPLNWLFMYGTTWGISPMGGAGCGLATAVIAWVGFFCALWVLKSDTRYRRFNIRFFQPINWPVMSELLQLGLPIGASYAIEITSFTLIAVLLAHQGVEVAAAHQITSNLLGLAYMVPLALSSAVSTLVAQNIGAHQLAQAKQIGLSGIRLVMVMALCVAAFYGLFGQSLAKLYLGANAGMNQVLGTATHLIQILALFIVFDAFQTVLAFILRAYKVASLPSVIYAFSLWGVGIGGGWWLTHIATPNWAANAAGYWWAGAAGVLIATVAFSLLLRRCWAQSLAPLSSAVNV